LGKNQNVGDCDIHAAKWSFENRDEVRKRRKCFLAEQNVNGKYHVMCSLKRKPRSNYLGRLLLKIQEVKGGESFAE